MYFSGATLGFYPKINKASYEAAGTWPADVVELTGDERAEFWMRNPPPGKRLGADENGRPAWVPIPPPPSDQLADTKRRELDTARDAAINAGFTHEFNGTPDTVQTRQRDRENITGLAVTAQLLMASGDSDTELPFRAASDATYMLTASDILTLAMAAQQHVSQQYGKAWALKGDLEAALSAGDRDALEAIAW